MLLSGVSVAFAIFFGICSKQRNEKKDTQEDAEQRATTDTKMLESNKAMQELVNGEAGEVGEKDM